MLFFAACSGCERKPCHTVFCLQHNRHYVARLTKGQFFYLYDQAQVLHFAFMLVCGRYDINSRGIYTGVS